MINTINCEHCDTPINVFDYLALATDPLYDQDGYYIIHSSCQSPHDTVIETCGDLVLVHSNESEHV